MPPIDGLKALTFHKNMTPDPTMGKKVAKQGALYIHRVGSDYLCKHCIMYIPEMQRCLIHSDTQVIKPNGTCGYWVKGKSYPGLKPMSALSKQESGYIEPPNGVTCARCEYFSATKEDCQVVDKDSPGDDPGKITAGACCANWEGK